MEPKLRGPKEAKAKYECAHELLTSYNKLNGLLPTLSVQLKLSLSNVYFFHLKFLEIVSIQGSIYDFNIVGAEC